MWRRTYLLLLLVRFYFAISPSYIHPDENFQGPEVIAGSLFSFPHHLTWEFTSDHPVRSVFPLWPVYGFPMVVLRWVWTETGKEEVAPEVIYYTLRVLMFILSFVLEDWAIYELIPSLRYRELARVLVASSYVTWTYQTHTFSNSIETLVVAWALVMIQRMLENKQRSSLRASALLGFFITFGIFNRITFPAFLFLPGLYLVPHFLRKPFSFIVFALTTLLTTLLAVIVDTSFYNSSSALPLPWHLLHSPTITPLNSLLYNASRSNLSLHGLHAPYHHLLVSLPLLLGPSLLLLPFSNLYRPRLPLLSAVSATILLSLIPHQEPRFLLPVVPLLLTSMHLPKSRVHTRYFLAAWVIFNTVLALLMGIFHQGGVVSAQIWLGEQRNMGIDEVFWWRTYSPPVWLLDGNRLKVTDLMGMDMEDMIKRLEIGIGDGCRRPGVGLVAPRSSTGLDAWTEGAGDGALVFEELWTYRRHVGLDDVDWGGEGVWQTLSRLVRRRGLTVWRVGRRCDGEDASSGIGNGHFHWAEWRHDGNGGVKDDG